MDDCLVYIGAGEQGGARGRLRVDVAWLGAAADGVGRLVGHATGTDWAVERLRSPEGWRVTWRKGERVVAWAAFYYASGPLEGQPEFFFADLLAEMLSLVRVMLGPLAGQEERPDEQK